MILHHQWVKENIGCVSKDKNNVAFAINKDGSKGLLFNERRAKQLIGDQSPLAHAGGLFSYVGALADCDLSQLRLDVAAQSATNKLLLVFLTWWRRRGK